MERMNQSVTETGVQMDIAMYFSRVITFGFEANGITMPFLQKSKIITVAD